MSLGRPLTQSIGAKVAGVWFGDDERAFATTVMSIASVFGALIGFGFPLIFISDIDKESPKDAIDKIWSYTLIQTIIAVLLSVPAFIFIRNLPTVPPSKSAEHFRISERMGSANEIKKLLSTANIWKFNIAYSLLFSMYTGKLDILRI